MSDRQQPFVDAEASCACGRVTVHVNGPVRSMFMCACEDCQRATGTGHSSVAIFDAGSVTVTGDVRSFDRPAASGAVFVRTFCPICGTPILGRSSRWTGAVMLPVGLLGHQTAWFVPSQLIFSRSHREWDTIAEALPRYETYRLKREEH